MEMKRTIASYKPITQKIFNLKSVKEDMLTKGQKFTTLFSYMEGVNQRLVLIVGARKIKIPKTQRNGLADTLVNTLRFIRNNTKEFFHYAEKRGYLHENRKLLTNMEDYFCDKAVNGLQYRNEICHMFPSILNPQRQDVAKNCFGYLYYVAGIEAHLAMKGATY